MEESILLTLKDFMVVLMRVGYVYDAEKSSFTHSVSGVPDTYTHSCKVGSVGGVGYKPVKPGEHENKIFPNFKIAMAEH